MTPDRRRAVSRALLLAACAAATPASPAGDGLPDSGSVVLRAEEDRELCRDLKAGEVLHWRFESNQPLVFTAHYHQGSDARSLWRRDELRQGEGDLKATVAARYCLTWFDYLDGALTLRWAVNSRH